jgi:tape measure domain-containing protein
MPPNLKSFISADINQLLRGYKQAEDAAVKTGAKMDAAFKGGGTILGGTASVAAGNIVSNVLGKVAGVMTSAVRDGIEYNKMLERSSVAFGVLTGSSREAQKHLSEIEKLALKTPFEFPDLINASIRLQSFGLSTQEVMRDLPKLSDAASIAAAGTGDFKGSLEGIITALGQMRTKGRLAFEEMNQLNERGIPAWDILSKKVGKSVQELQRLAERGKLSGKVGAELLTKGLGEFSGGIGEKLSQTASGKESNLEDAYRKRAGEDTKKLFDAYKESLDQGIKAFEQGTGKEYTGKLGNALADNLQLGNEVMKAANTGKIGELAKDALVGTLEAIKPGLSKSGADLWKALQDGFTGAIASYGASAYQSVSTWAKGLVDSAKSYLGIKSPSTVFEDIGQDVVKGFDQGIEQNIDRSSEGFKKWAKQIEKIGGEAFLQAVEEMSKRLNIDPNKAMNVMAFESRLNPAAKNPKSSASGLIQFMDETATAFKTTTDKLRSMGAIEQLKYVEEYFAQFRRLMDSQASLYTAVLAGRPINNPDQVLFRNAPGRAGRNYRANAPLDADKSGGITVAEATAKVVEQGFVRPAREVVNKLAESVPLTRGMDNLFALLNRPSGPIPIAQASEVMKALTPPIKLVAEAAKAAPLPLEQTAKAIDRVAQESGDAWNEFKGQKSFSQLMRQAVIDAKDALDPEETFKRFQDFNERIGQGIDSTIQSLLTRTQSLGDAARSILLSTVNEIFNSLISEIITKASGGQASSIGGLIGNAIGGLFGGFFSGGGKAAGGPVYAGTPYMVGERGPEPFIPQVDGRILSRQDAMRAMSGGGGSTVVNVSFQVTAQDGRLSKETQAQTAARMAEAINHAHRRNN